MSNLNPKAATVGQGSFCFKCTFVHWLILSTVFRTFSKLIISNKKYTLKIEPIYPLHKFKENPPIFMKLHWRWFLFWLFFTLIFIL